MLSKNALTPVYWYEHFSESCIALLSQSKYASQADNSISRNGNPI
jgi:hypothetical protein